MDLVIVEVQKRILYLGHPILPGTKLKIHRHELAKMEAEGKVEEILTPENRIHK